MAYIGKSPTGTGVRSRYYYTATGGETSLSGADDNSNTLVFSDGNYVDVSLNGIALVAGTDYNTSTANTISGLSALSASDIVEIVVYDIFTVADTVSAVNGGTFSGNVAMGGTLSVTGAATATGGLNVGTIKDAAATTTAMTINSSGQILTPARPSFHVTQIEPSTAAARNGQYSFNTVRHNVGSHWDTTNNNKFVAPVAGVYHFSFTGLGCNSSVGAIAAGSAGGVNIEKSVDSGSNWTALSLGYGYVTSSTHYATLATSVTVSLGANDYVRLNVFGQYVYSDASAAQQYAPVFSGFLVG